jgi:hypothetical protein
VYAVSPYASKDVPPPSAMPRFSQNLNHMFGHLCFTMVQIMRFSWLSLLLQTKVFVKRGSVWGLVIGVTEWGFQYIRWHPQRHENKVFWSKLEQTDDIEPLVCVISSSLDDWQVCELECVPPCARDGRVPDSLGSTSRLAILPRPPKSLLRFSAGNAFPNMTNTHMKKLLTFLNVRFGARRRPVVEHEVLRWLAAFILNVELTNDDVLKPIISKRGCKTSSKFKSALTAENVDLVEGVVNQEDTADIRDRIKASQPAKPKGKAKVSPAAGGGAAVPSKARIGQMVGGAAVGIDVVRGLLPNASGCTAVKDTTFHFRFKVHYRRPDGTRYQINKSWNDEITQWHAALCCVYGAWCEHELGTGEACPHPLQAWCPPGAKLD